MAEGEESKPRTDNADDDLRRFYSDNGLTFRAVDLLCLGDRPLPEVVRPYLKIFLRLRDKNGANPIRKVLVIVPPGRHPQSQVARLEERLRTWMSGHVDLLPTGETAQSWFEIVQSGDLRTDSLLAAAERASDATVALVVDASDYRDAAVRTEADAPAAIPEDIWTPQLVCTVDRLAELAERKGCYVVADAGKLLPRRQSHMEALVAGRSSAMCGASPEVDGEAYVAEHLEEWDRFMDEGRLGQVVASIDAFEDWTEAERLFYRIQVLDRAGLEGLALDLIEKVDIDAIESVHALARLAKVAANCGATSLASRLLLKALPDLVSLDGSLLALDVADDIGDWTIGDRIASAINRQYPGHPAVLRRQFATLFQDGRFTELADALDGSEDADPKDASFYRTLADRLGHSGVPDYPALCDELNRLYPERRSAVPAILGRDALRRSLPLHAVRAVAPVDDGDRPAVRVVLDAIEMQIFAGAGAERHIDLANLETAVKETVRYLAANPQDGGTRVRLTALLAPDGAGTIGLVATAAVAVSLLERPLDVTPVPKRSRPAGNIERILDDGVLKRLFLWLDGEKEIVLGKAILPLDRIECDPDDLAEALVRLIAYTSQQLSDEHDITSLKAQILLGLAVNPHTELKKYDLEIWRMAGPALAHVGQVQTARDLAEHLLQSSTDTSQRRRMAWAVFADIYHRTGSRLESMIGFAAAAAGGREVSPEQVWVETTGLTRICRDMGLFPAARNFLSKAGQMLVHMKLDRANAHRQRFLAFTIDFAEAVAGAGPPPNRVAEMLEVAGLCAEEAVSLQDNALPVATVTAQAIALARTAGLPVPERVLSSFDALCDRLGVAARDLTRALASSGFDADALFRIHRGFELARHAEDAGHDARLPAAAARRMLSTATDDSQPEAITFAVELLADRAIARPGWDVASRPVPPIGDVEEPTRTAAALVAEGFSVIAMAAADHLVTVTWDAVGARVNKVDQAEFSLPNYREWTDNYPFRYGTDAAKVANLFYTTTETLRIDDMPDGPVVVVADAELQLLPPNVIRCGEEFAGSSRPMVAVPSFSWLKAALERPTATDGVSRAWISEETAEGQTLASLVGWLEEPLLAHGASLDTGAAIPENLGGSELVVVGAHGGLGKGDRFFQRVTDEGALSVSGRELADSLRNVGVVVLFVCSGGRADKAPDGVAVVGLSKALLERGSSAVIGSPWPIDPRVAYRWLPKFLEEWRAGATVAEANFRGNKAVEDGFGFVPEKCLAMTVYGNPMLRRADLRAPLA